MSTLATGMCGRAPSARGTTVVAFDSLLSRIRGPRPPGGQPVVRLATRSVTVGGYRGREGEGTGHSTAVANELGGEGFLDRLGPVHYAVLVLPRPGVVLTVIAPRLATAERIVSTARVVMEADSNGCAARVSRLSPAGPSLRRGSLAQLVPDTPQAVSVCRYAYDWLNRSRKLTNASTSRLQSLLNALAPGVSVGTMEEVPSDCRQDLHRGFIAQFTYASGPPVDVYIHIGGCAALSATNGSRTTQLDALLVNFLTDTMGYDSGFADPNDLRPSEPPIG